MLACLTERISWCAVLLPLAVTSHAFRFSRAPVCLVNAVIMAGVNVVCCASLLHLVILSGERHVAIKPPLHCDIFVTARRLTIAVATAWAIPVAFTALSAPVNIVLRNLTALAETIVAILTLEMIGILATIRFCQVAVFLESRRHRQHILALQVSGVAALEILKKDKAARTMTMVVGDVLLC